MPGADPEGERSRRSLLHPTSEEAGEIDDGACTDSEHEFRLFHAYLLLLCKSVPNALCIATVPVQLVDEVKARDERPSLSATA